VQLGGLKKFIDAFVGLYSSLSTQQKKIADALFRIAPLSMVGGIPEPAEALIAPAPSYSVPIYTSYALLPTPYPIYRYYPYYPAYPVLGFCVRRSDSAARLVLPQPPSLRRIPRRGSSALKRRDRVRARRLAVASHLPLEIRPILRSAQVVEQRLRGGHLHF
jgi:hypothetical protein